MDHTTPGAEPQVFEFLRNARRAKGFHSYRALAEASRLSWGHIGQIENGRTQLTWPACAALALALEISPHELWDARPSVVLYPSRTAAAA